MNLLSFDLNLLKVLDALLRDHSTKLAGQRVGLSQPAVSAALKRLREALGDPLFVRHGQRLVPTDYARTLEAPVRRILDEIEEVLRANLGFDPSTSTRNFKLSTSDFFTEMFMNEFSARLGQIAPGVRFQIIELEPEDYVGRIGRFEADLAMIPALGDLPPWANNERL